MTKHDQEEFDQKEFDEDEFDEEQFEEEIELGEEAMVNSCQQEITKNIAEILLGKKAVITFIGPCAPQDLDPAVFPDYLVAKPITSGDDLVRVIFRAEDETPFDNSIFIGGYFPFPEANGADNSDKDDDPDEPEVFFVKLDYSFDGCFSSVIGDYSLGDIMRDIIEEAIEFAENLDSEFTG
jgi:hypothetical protein